jgi:hypothetical protein
MHVVETDPTVLPRTVRLTAGQAIVRQGSVVSSLARAETTREELQGLMAGGDEILEFERSPSPHEVGSAPVR